MRDADFVLKLPDQILGVVWPVERLSVRIFAWPGMVAPDDHVVCAVIAPDDRVPERLPRPSHAHRQRQQRQDDAVRIVVVLRQRLVGADPRVMIDVPRLGHANGRMQQQHPIDLGDSPLGQLLVHAVQWVARLERHDVLAAGLGQDLAGLGRRAAQLLKVIVTRELKDSDGTGRVEPPQRAISCTSGCRES